MSGQPAHAFGPFRVDAVERLLWYRDSRVELRGKAFDVLLVLIRADGAAVSKEMLMRSVWQGMAVEESNLTVAMSHLRRAIRDAGGAEYIETLTGRGYRFLPDGVPITKAHRGSSSGLRAAAPDSGTRFAAVPLATPFVGRSLELDTLERAMADVHAGEHRTILVTGVAGIGKTALLETFLRKLEATGEAFVARGTCVKLHGAGEPYLPVIGALLGLCRQRGGEKLVESLCRLAPTWALQLPELLTSGQLDLVTRQVLSASSSRMVRELTAALESIAAQKALVWCVEDLHWADASTLDLLTHLARRSDLRHVLILGTHRPFEGPDSSSVLVEVVSDLKLRGSSTSLQLEPLTSEQVAQYLDARFSNNAFPDALPRLIHRRTLGSPLFVVQWADALFDAGLIDQSGGVWALRVSIEVAARHLPGTTAETIEMQVDRLSPREQTWLDVACVCGETFAVAAIAEVLDEDALEIERACLTWSRQNRLVRIVGETAWGDSQTTVCSLSHAVYQEVLYRRLGVANRARLHHRLGECLERAHAGHTAELAVELAVHFERAGQVDRAIRYLLMAARAGVARCAYVSAVDQLERGLLLLPSSSDVSARRAVELELQSALASLLSMTRGHGAPEVQRINRRVLELYELLDDAPLASLFGAWMSIFILAKYAAADALASQFERSATRRGNEMLTAAASVMAGLCALYRGSLRVALRKLEFGLSVLGSKPQAQRSIADTLDPLTLAYNLSWALWTAGYPDSALSLAEQSLASSTLAERPYSCAYLMHFSSVVRDLRGEYRTALEQASSMQVYCDKHDFGFFIPLVRAQQAVARMFLGDTSAVADLARCTADFRSTGSEVAITRLLAMLAEGWVMTGQLSDALATLREAFSLVVENDEHFWESELHRLQGEIWLCLPQGQSALGCDQGTSNATTAEECLLRAVAVAQSQEARSLELRATMSLARLWQQGPRRDEARRLLEAVYSGFVEGFETRELKAARSLLQSLGASVDASSP